MLSDQPEPAISAGGSAQAGVRLLGPEPCLLALLPADHRCQTLRHGPVASTRLGSGELDFRGLPMRLSRLQILRLL